MSERLLASLIKPALGFGLQSEGKSLEDNLAKDSLTNKQIVSVLENTGRDLAKIHSITGEKYGWINPLQAIITRKFVGRYNNQYEFLLAFYDHQTQVIDKILADEKETGKFFTPLSQENRERFEYLHKQRPLVREIFEKRKGMLQETKPQVLHGNLYIGSIFVSQDGDYSGLGDFTQMLVGDPVNDLAYFSVMPQGEALLPHLQKGWKEVATEMDDEEKLHIYRLWESYRKIYTRYSKHRYLDNYPEPIKIGQEEIENLK